MPSTDKRIQPALHAFLAADVDGLRTAIAADPDVVNLRIGENTMLELATQPHVSPVEGQVIDVLIETGASLDRALNLAGCWNLADMCRQLLSAGADPTARADAGITPLESAAMHGSTDAAEVLVERGVHRRSLWLAAAAGQLDLVRQWVGEQGELLAAPGHRPNWADVGGPGGAPPTDDPAEVIGEAFVFAGANGRRDVADYLLDTGADIDSRPYRNTTALHFAVQFRKLDMVRRLLRRGASTTIEDDQYHSDARGWAVACDKGTEPSSTIRFLLARDDS
jgi:ankyrin repeat protein